MYRKTFFLAMVFVLIAVLLSPAVLAAPPLQEKCDQVKLEDGTLVVTCTLDDGATEPVKFPPIEVQECRPLRFEVVGKEPQKRPYFSLEIGDEDYPSCGVFNIQVRAIPTAYMVTKRKEYPEFDELKEDKIFRIAGYSVNSPFAFEVFVKDKGDQDVRFANPVSVGIAVNIPKGKQYQYHRIIIYHERDDTLEFVPANFTFPRAEAAEKEKTIHGFLLAPDSIDHFGRCHG